MKKGFTLVEMLVVIGIIAILIGAGIGSFSSMTKRANNAKGQELVSNVATALEAIYQKDGCWPHRILSEGASDGEIDAKIAYDITSKGMMSLTKNSNKDIHETAGLDRFGIVSPWAAAVVKRGGSSGVSESSKVPSGGTIRDHRLHFAVDTDDDGFVDASVGGTTVKIRGSVAVWCCGLDGVIDPYPYASGGSGGKGASSSKPSGSRSDDIYSWSVRQLKK